MTAKRRGGLGRGLGALIPTSAAATDLIMDEAIETSTEPGAQQASNGHSRPGPVTAGPGRDDNAERIDHDSTDSTAHTRQPDSAGDDGGPLPVPGARFAEVQIEQIVANPKQPRQAFDDDALAELTHSIREFGVLQPVVVRETSAGYELIMGERRLRAAQAAGLSIIPAIVRDTADDAMLRDALLENIHRAALNPLEEAAAYQQLLEEFGTTHEELASRIGRSRSQVSNTIRLLNLPVAVQRRVAAGILSAGHARALLGLADRELQEELAARIVAEGLSVRATEELVSVAGSARPAAKTARARTARITAPGIADLADKLADAFETRVRVELGRRKGKITVEFASVDDLERIVALMAPRLASRPLRSVSDGDG